MPAAASSALPASRPAPAAAAQAAFANRLLEILNHGALGLCISIAHRTGLFDALANGAAVTSAELASRAGLDERYVREWAGAMLAGRIVLPAGPGRFHLPPEHAAHLTRAAAPENLAVGMQFLAVLGGVEDRIVHCFRHGGGVPYSGYPRFHEVMAEESAQTVVAALEQSVLPLVPEVAARLRAGIDVLDVGCGRGGALLRLAELFPSSRFTGFDFEQDVVRSAREAAAARGLANARFEVHDVADVRDAQRFDLITAFDAIHDQAQPAAVLAGIARALRPGGTFLMQDIHAHSAPLDNLDSPFGPFGYTISCLHCMSVSLAQGGAGLGAMWGRELALSMLREAGFRDVSVHTPAHDILNLWYVARRD